MTTIRKPSLIIFRCDECGDKFDCDTDDFQEAWATARQAGWIARKYAEEGTWRHSCPTCS